VIEKIHRFSLSELIYREERGSKDKVNRPEETKAVKSDMQQYNLNSCVLNFLSRCEGRGNE
jgi:hypothetical protein